MSAFPHSDIHGSGFICNSPWLFAAYHVLLRRLMPRHPPYALISLIVFNPLNVFLSENAKLTFSVLGFYLDHYFKFFLQDILFNSFYSKNCFMLIHNTLLIYSYNIICFCFVIQLSMYVACLLPDF